MSAFTSKLENAAYVTVGRGGHTVHWPPHRDGALRYGQCTCQGYEGSDGPTVLRAIALGLSVIDSTVIDDSAICEVIGFPVIAAGEGKVDREPWHGMSYAPLAYVTGLYAALGATVHNLPIDPGKAAADLAAYRVAKAERRAAYDAAEAERERKAERAALAAAFKHVPDMLNMPRRCGSKREIHKLPELLARLAESEGFASFAELVDERGSDSTVPGICWLCRSYVADVEPDQAEGFCESCGEGSVIAATEFALAL